VDQKPRIPHQLHARHPDRPQPSEILGHFRVLQPQEIPQRAHHFNAVQLRGGQNTRPGRADVRSQRQTGRRTGTYSANGLQHTRVPDRGRVLRQRAQPDLRRGQCRGRRVPGHQHPVQRKDRRQKTRWQQKADIIDVRLSMLTVTH